METRANHLLIGLFTLLVVAGAFGFVYWLARLDDAGSRTPVHVMFDGAVTGLNPGSSVLFNGIKVGEVTSLTVDPNQPKRVRALIKVDPTTPIKRDTVARLEYQGLTGVGIVQLLGGSPGAESLLARNGKTIPEIVAQKGPLQSLLEAGETIMTKGSAVLERLDAVLGSNEGSLGETLANVNKFTGALARNADRIDGFFQDASQLASRLNNMSSGLDGLISGINSLVGEGGGDLMKNVGSAFRRVDKFLADNEASLSDTVKNVDAFSKVLAANTENVDQFMADARAMVGKLNSMSTKVEALVDNANAIVRDDAGPFIKDAGAVFARLEKFLGANEEALGKTISNMEAFTGTLAKNRDTVELVMKDAATLAAKLNAVSDDIGRMVNRVDGLVAEDGAAFMREARLAAETFRKMATELSGKIDAATEGLNRLSGRSIKEIETFAVEGRSTLRDMQRVMDRLERNPQRFFFGRSQLPETRSR